ncbi:MAG: hypothetical protein K9J12_03240 [Melioribacteraceae bacterium]|nr:hypothetical protein [Melioribacteraceae bacterium]MCF8265237.1 hypothetical protein [Melioribacteraceae bacterium]MCF8413014.1 hypothetical protein [Melioribacteraceae bacterium]MCF8432713.1 hypothetical protein [Melioribacteraceae bacterium]
MAKKKKDRDSTNISIHIAESGAEKKINVLTRSQSDFKINELGTSSNKFVFINPTGATLLQHPEILKIVEDKIDEFMKNWQSSVKNEIGKMREISKFFVLTYLDYRILSDDKLRKKYTEKDDIMNELIEEVELIIEEFFELPEIMIDSFRMKEEDWKNRIIDIEMNYVRRLLTPERAKLYKKIARLIVVITNDFYRGYGAQGLACKIMGTDPKTFSKWKTSTLEHSEVMYNLPIFEKFQENISGSEREELKELVKKHLEKGI